MQIRWSLCISLTYQGQRLLTVITWCRKTDSLNSNLIFFPPWATAIPVVFTEWHVKANAVNVTAKNEEGHIFCRKTRFCNLKYK